MMVASLRCNTFYVYRIDAEKHLGLSSLIDVHSLEASIKARFQLSKFLQLLQSAQLGTG
jgi:hypothetical protein